MLPALLCSAQRFYNSRKSDLTRFFAFALHNHKTFKARPRKTKFILCTLISNCLTHFFVLYHIARAHTMVSVDFSSSNATRISVTYQTTIKPKRRNEKKERKRKMNAKQIPHRAVIIFSVSSVWYAYTRLASCRRI